MATPSAPNKKGKQLSLEEYAKIKEKIAKSRLKLQFPLIVKICFFVPLAYCLFLIFYFLFYLRFVAQR